MFKPRASDYPKGSVVRRQLEQAEKDSKAIAERFEERTTGPIRMARPEQELQILCVEYADHWRMPFTEEQRQLWPQRIAWSLVGRHLYHIPNGGWRTSAEAGIFRAMGVRPGVADLFFGVPVQARGRAWAGMYLECKAGSNDLTDNQKDFLRWAYAMGYEICEIRSLDEFQEEITNYLKGAGPLNL